MLPRTRKIRGETAPVNSLKGGFWGFFNPCVFLGRDLGRRGEGLLARYGPIGGEMH